MPLYEYGCPVCRHAWDELQDRWDSEAPACPACGAVRSVRRLSTFAVVAHGAAAARAPEGACGTDSCACRQQRDLS